MIDDLDLKIIEYKKQKLSPISIAKKLGVDRIEVIRRLRRLEEEGIFSTTNIQKSNSYKSEDNIAKTDGRYKTQLDEIDEQIIRYLENGDTVTTIATKIGMAHSSISLKIKKIENLLGRKLPRNDGRKKVVIDEIDEQIIEYLG